MQGDKKVIQFLNDVLANELIAINQYFLHSRMYENFGYEKLASKEYEESIDEMKHADELTKRILFLEGIPNVQNLGKLFIGENVEEIIKCDLQLERQAHNTLQKAIAHCESVSDFVSRDLLKNILQSEEEHIDWLETQQNLIAQVGLQNYLQSQI